jgi:hypothetical protein
MRDRDSKPPPAPPKTKGSYKYRLLDPKGTVLASCPSQLAALKSAKAMYGPLWVRESQGDWGLYDTTGTLVAIVTSKK